MEHSLDMAQGIGVADLAGTPHFRLRDGGAGYRIEYEAPFGTGGTELHPFSPQMMLALSDFRCHGASVDSNAACDLVKIHVQLKGRAEFAAGRREFRVTGMSAGILFHPEGCSKAERYPASDRQQALTLICAPGYLRQLFADAADLLPDAARDNLFAPAMDFAYFDFPLSHDVALAAEALLHERDDAGLTHLRLHARALDLLHRFFTAGRPEERALGRRDRDRAAAAREHLERHYASPPTIAALAHRLGTNEARLADAFKRRYGMTLYDFVQKLRMDHACNLLRHSDLSITEIALEVGYEHPGNFATAFRRRYGMTPRAFRNA